MTRPISIAVATACLTLSALVARSSEVAGPTRLTASVPQTATSSAFVDLTSRAERAITRYIATCTSGEAHALSALVTEDLRVDYALEEPDTYLSMSQPSLTSSCAIFGGEQTRVANLWIFPTADGKSVFVRYEVRDSVSSTSHEHLSLLEMRGDRIARLLNFSSMPAELAADAN